MYKKFLIIFLVFLFGMLLLLVLAQKIDYPVISFLKGENINIIEKTKNSIVIIIPEQKLISYKNNPKGIISDYKSSGIGAGFIISEDGLVQTVNHLVQDDNLLYKIIYNNKEYETEVVSRDSENDLAILKINPNNNALFPLLNKEGVRGWSNGENIISFGIDIKNLEIVYNNGKIINTKSKLDKLSNLLEISNNLTPGFSGGPIINSEGNVVGINYAVSEGRNYGISIK